MKLKYHDRYDYLPITDRADFDWPDGKRLALHVALNVEHFIFGGSGHFAAAIGHPPDHRNYAWREYGVRLGFWRLVELFDQFELPASHLVNTACYDHYPQIFERIRQRSDEIVGHGRTNSERQGEMLEEDEARLIHQVTETIRHHEGAPPLGWMGPWISESHVTLDLLREEGYTYCMDWPCDDQPIWLRTRSGPILSVPYPTELNDAPSQLTRHEQPVDFANLIIDQFDEMLRQSEQAPLVMGISLHTFIMGQPFRLTHLRRAFEHIRNHPDVGRVWFARPGEIARHAMSLPEEIVPRPL